MGNYFCSSDTQWISTDSPDAQAEQCPFPCTTLLLKVACVFGEWSVSSGLGWSNSAAGGGKGEAGRKRRMRAASGSRQQLTETHVGTSRISCCPLPSPVPGNATIHGYMA